jgi:CheY-like chemotaxis protein
MYTFLYVSMAYLYLSLENLQQAKLGYRADVVANGLEAIAALQDIPYDLVLMDCQMPELDGYEATRRIRAPDSGVLQPTVPIVAMTANAMKGDREKCLEAGMDDYIAKPVQPGELRGALERWSAGLVDRAPPGELFRQPALGSSRNR